MSTSRLAVLEALQQQVDPVPLPALTAATGLHINTVREHLDALERAGLVRRQRSEPNGRGRPAWCYQALDARPGQDDSEYLGLAATLASFIARTSDSPHEDAVAAGTEWGRDLARERSTAGHDGRRDHRDEHRRVVHLLADIGFAPTTDAEHRVVRLTRCPLLETARAYPEVICGVHLGIVRGALAEYGADPVRADLTPFAEPGACRLDLVPDTSSRRR